mgnify:CR=1 FL=1
MVPPDGGSRILFFSGGTAFGSGWRRNSPGIPARRPRHHHIRFRGQFRRTRRAFDMPAVGDIRARIMALADRSLEGNPETVELLGYRLPKDAGPEALHLSWRLSRPERIRWWPRFPSP